MQGGHNKACTGYDGCINQAEERFHVKGNHINKMHWDNAHLHQSTSYQCCHLANQYEQQIYVR